MPLGGDQGEGPAVVKSTGNNFPDGGGHGTPVCNIRHTSGLAGELR